MKHNRDEINGDWRDAIIAVMAIALMMISIHAVQINDKYDNCVESVQAQRADEPDPFHEGYEQ